MTKIEKQANHQGTLHRKLRTICWDRHRISKSSPYIRYDCGVASLCSSHLAQSVRCFNVTPPPLPPFCIEKNSTQVPYPISFIKKIARIDQRQPWVKIGDSYLRADKTGGKVHLDWSLYGGSENFRIYYTINDFTFSNPSVLQETPNKTYDHNVLNDGNNYAYRIYKNVPTEGLFFYHTDHLMTPLQMTDENQNVVWQAEYYPFGRIYSQSGDIENNLRFPGQYSEPNINLYYNWHRYYSPKIGKYLSKDPIVWKIGGYLDEFYNYSLNNPIINYDIKGEAVRTKLCTASQNAKIQQAAQKADAASQKCLPCEDRPKFRRAIRSMGTKREIVFYCVGKQNDPSTGRPLCGYTTISGNIAISDFAIEEVSGCGCLESTILHEVLHTIGYVHPQNQYAERRCFKCAVN